MNLASSQARVSGSLRERLDTSAFQGLFRGALKIGATHFTDAMKIAAAHAIAGQTKLDTLVPNILDRDARQAVAGAVTQAWWDDN